MLVGQRGVHARLQSCVDCAPAVCRHQPLLFGVFEFRFDPCLLEASRLRRGTHLAVSLSALSWVEVASLDLPVAQVEGATLADFNCVGVLRSSWLRLRLICDIALAAEFLQLLIWALVLANIRVAGL